MRTAIFFLVMLICCVSASAPVAADDGMGRAPCEIAYVSLAPLNRHAYVADADGSNARPSLALDAVRVMTGPQKPGAPPRS